MKTDENELKRLREFRDSVAALPHEDECMPDGWENDAAWSQLLALISEARALGGKRHSAKRTRAC